MPKLYTISNNVYYLNTVANYEKIQMGCGV
jgi:hypothetical protein